MRKSLKVVLLAGLALIILFVAYYAMAAANVMPGSSSMDEYSQPIYPGDVAPVECAGITFTGKNQLVLGTTGNDTLDGSNGSDCLVGGGGNDVLTGKQGGDVLIGGDGTDTFYGGQGQDVCYGCVGVETFSSCETVHNVCP
jgi:hypothetical protein